MTERLALYKGVSKIAWGFVFVLFHFTINGFDLLPDFIGYFLMFLGVNEIKPEFRNAKILMPLAVFLSIWNIFSLGLAFGFLSEPGFLNYVSTVISIVVLVYNFMLLTDLSLIARRYQPADKDIDKKLITARNIYTVCSVITLSATFLSYITDYPEGITVALSFISLIVMLVTMIVILVAIFSLRKIFKEEVPFPGYDSERQAAEDFSTDINNTEAYNPPDETENR